LDLAVQKVVKGRIDLWLYKGILVGEYDGRKGGTLRIRSPRATTEIVGTLFSVEADDGQSRISVARGRVNVQTAGKTVMVVALKTWSTAKLSSGPTPASVTALFAKHDRPAVASVNPAKSSKADQRPPARATSTHDKIVAPKPRLEPPTVVPQKPRPKRAPPGLVPTGASPKPPPERAPSNISARMPSEGSKDKAPTKAEDNKTPKVPAKATSASVLYRSAETALKKRDEAKAEQVLVELIKRHPQDALVGSARYELALLLIKNGSRRRADDVLRKINKTSRFLGPAHNLRCRIRQEMKKIPKAIVCFRAFVREFPNSPHAKSALVTLIKLSAAQRDCKSTLEFSARYLASYPAGRQADEAKRLRQTCSK